MMLQSVFYNIGGNTGHRWLRATRPCVHHRELAWFVPRDPVEHRGHGTSPALPSPGDWEPLDIKAARNVFCN